MAFLVYSRTARDGKDLLTATGMHFVPGGYGLLRQAWEKCGKPTNQGWDVSADELVRIYSKDQNTYANMRLIIDFDPDSNKQIGLIEILHAYIYTWRHDKPGTASWSPLMLKLRDVYYEYDEKGFSKQNIAEKKMTITNPVYQMQGKGEPFAEFLYLNGDDKQWRWGRTGTTNAGFLQGEALKYFKEVFVKV